MGHNLEAGEGGVRHETRRPHPARKIRDTIKLMDHQRTETDHVVFAHVKDGEWPARTLRRKDKTKTLQIFGIYYPRPHRQLDCPFAGKIHIGAHYAFRKVRRQYT